MSQNFNEPKKETPIPVYYGDDLLVKECLEVLEYVTYHGGRYSQEQNKDWQSQAQQLVRRLATRVGREAYEGYGSK